MVRYTLLALAALAGPLAAAERPPFAPHAQAVLGETAVAAWDFARAADAWPVLNQCQSSVRDGTLRLECRGPDPYVRVPLPRGGLPGEGPLVLRAKVRSTAPGGVQLFWATGEARGFTPEHVVTVDGPPVDGAWHDLKIELPAGAAVTGLRLDPAMGQGLVELREARLVRVKKHPLVLEELGATPEGLRARVRNTSAGPVSFALNGKTHRAGPGGTVTAVAPRGGAAKGTAFAAEDITLEGPDGVPPLKRTIYVPDPGATVPDDAWLTLEGGRVRLRVARDGTGARVFWKGRLVAHLYPLAEHDGKAVPLQAARDGDAVVLSGGPVERLALRLDGDEVRLDLKAGARVTGPAVRVAGRLEQGLLAGVEHLGKDEVSSSTLDLEGPASVRFEPDPLHLAMPLAAVVSEHHAAALLWDDPALQPVFSCPNRYDGTPDHLMAVKGPQARLRLRLGDGFADGARLEDAVLWAVQARGGLPPVPPVPRTAEAQRALNLAALNGAVRGPQGWRHVADGSPGQPFADHVSTLLRLGETPEVARLVPGGSHVENDAAYLLTGRAKEWLAVRGGQAEALRRTQRPDGSWGYEGKYRRGHFEDTASGICARPAAILLEHALRTGDERSRAAGLKALDSMKKFRTPRGAQTWEIPLHTPDVYASAWLVWAYVRGYELTGNAEYLALARRWALSGVPFVYLWDRFPVMRYATTPVLGATDWTSVVWIGLPVQWCGTAYAHALLELAAHDKTLDWRRLAEGILVCAEQMQYPDGPHAGTLPDSYNLAAQRRQPADINPCVLVLLRDMLAGRPGGLYLARDGGRRVVAPFPVTLRDGKAVVDGKKGVRYEVVVDGSRVVPVVSAGRDEIALP